MNRLRLGCDAYYRIGKLPAVVNISAGPAALNTLNGVYGSYVDSVPVVYISGQPKTSQLVRSTGLPLHNMATKSSIKSRI